jgi:hypothetical protein
MQWNEWAKPITPTSSNRYWTINLMTRQRAFTDLETWTAAQIPQNFLNETQGAAIFFPAKIQSAPA